MVGGLSRGEPPFRLPGLRLDDRQAGVTQLADEPPAVLGDRTPDQPADPPVAVAPGQFHELVPVRVHVHPQREQPCPRDPDAAEAIVLNQVDAVRGDDIRLGDHIRIRQRAHLVPCHEAEPAITWDPDTAVCRKQLVNRVGRILSRLARHAEECRHRVPKSGRGWRGAVGLQVHSGQVGADVLQGAASSGVMLRRGVGELSYRVVARISSCAATLLSDAAEVVQVQGDLDQHRHR